MGFDPLPEHWVGVNGAEAAPWGLGTGLAASLRGV